MFTYGQKWTQCSLLSPIQGARIEDVHLWAAQARVGATHPPAKDHSPKVRFTDHTTDPTKGTFHGSERILQATQQICYEEKTILDQPSRYSHNATPCSYVWTNVQWAVPQKFYSHTLMVAHSESPKIFLLGPRRTIDSGGKGRIGCRS